MTFACTEFSLWEWANQIVLTAYHEARMWRYIEMLTEYLGENPEDQLALIG